MLRAGGWMMLPLVGVALWLAYLLLVRSLQILKIAWLFQRGEERGVSILTSQAGGGVMILQARTQEERAIISLQMRDTLLQGQLLSQSLIASAPLMGLLGTVSGMIAIFGALAEGDSLQPASGMARGIAQALLTTQLGLGIALPSLLWHRLLNQAAQRLQQRLQLFSLPVSFEEGEDVDTGEILEGRSFSEDFAVRAASDEDALFSTSQGEGGADVSPR
jgi:biopolymer transport protein ExbB